MAGDDLAVVRRSNGRLLVMCRGRLVAGYTVGQWRSYIYPVLTPAGWPLTDWSAPNRIDRARNP